LRSAGEGKKKKRGHIFLMREEKERSASTNDKETIYTFTNTLGKKEGGKKRGEIKVFYLSPIATNKRGKRGRLLPS